MKVSTKGRYALNMLIYLASNDDNKDEYVSLKNISEKLEISFKYLEKIANILVKNNLLEVSRGKQGGYRLVKKIEEYNVGEIFKITEKNMESVECVLHPESCKHTGKCKRHKVFKNLDKVIEDYLYGVTLKDII